MKKHCENGLAVAKALEADDRIAWVRYPDLPSDPNYELAKKNDADIVKSDYYEFLTKENQFRKTGIISRKLVNKIITAKDEPQILKILPSIWSSIYRRSFLEKNNIRFLETPGASYQDTSFAFKTLSLAEKTAFTVKAYLFYRTDNESSSVNSSGKVYAICDEYAEITKFLETNPKIKEFANDIKLIKEYDAYFWNAKRVAPKFRKEFVDKFSEIFKEYEQKGELTDAFYKKHSRLEINTLLNDKKTYRKIEKLSMKRVEIRASY